MFRRHYRPVSFGVTYPSAREIAARLDGDARPDASGNYECHCPGPLHRRGDQTPSLSIKHGKNGRPLLFCHAGCDYRDIVVALAHVGILPRRER